MIFIFTIFTSSTWFTIFNALLLCHSKIGRLSGQCKPEVHLYILLSSKYQYDTVKSYYFMQLFSFNGCSLYPVLQRVQLCSMELYPPLHSSQRL